MVVAGFVLQGNPVTQRGVMGASAVCCGALGYATAMSGQDQESDKDKKKKA